MDDEKEGYGQTVPVARLLVCEQGLAASHPVIENPIRQAATLPAALATHRQSGFGAPTTGL